MSNLIKTKNLSVEIEGYFDGANDPINVAIAIDNTCITDLSVYVRNLFASNASNARVHISYFDDTPVLPESDLDFAVVLANHASSILDFAKQTQDKNIPVFIAVENEHNFVTSNGKDALSALSGDYCIYGEGQTNQNKQAFKERLGRWVVAVCQNKKVAFGRAFAFIARPIALDAVTVTAAENAAIGIVPFLGGADFPLMIANQEKMLGQIAAVYGQKFDKTLLAEAAAVLVTGFFSKRATKLIDKILPLPKFLIHGAGGFFFTLGIGRCLVDYFEAGGNMIGLMTAIENIMSDAKSALAFGMSLVPSK